MAAPETKRFLKIFFIFFFFFLARKNLGGRKSGGVFDELVQDLFPVGHVVVWIEQKGSCHLLVKGSQVVHVDHETTLVFGDDGAHALHVRAQRQLEAQKVAKKRLGSRIRLQTF